MKIHDVPTVLLPGRAVVLLAGGLSLLVKGRTVRRTAASFRSRAVRTMARVVTLEAQALGLGTHPDTRDLTVVWTS